MEREKYIMSLAEIKALVAGFMQFGAIETYAKMREKAFLILEQAPQLDEEFMDRSETLLQKAREEPIEEASENEATLRDIYYTLSFLLRKLAHEIHSVLNNKKESNRFLRIIVNDNAPKLLI